MMPVQMIRCKIKNCTDPRTEFNNTFQLETAHLRNRDRILCHIFYCSCVRCSNVSNNKYIILILINLLLVFVGMFMETIAAIIILFPVLLNLVLQVGVDPIQFGVMVVLNLVIGLCTPPVGVCLFAATNIGETKLTGVVKELVPFLISNFVVLALVTFVPFITTGVANLIMGAS